MPFIITRHPQLPRHTPEHFTLRRRNIIRLAGRVWWLFSRSAPPCRRIHRSALSRFSDGGAHRNALMPAEACLRCFGICDLVSSYRDFIDNDQWLHEVKRYHWQTYFHVMVIALFPPLPRYISAFGAFYRFTCSAELSGIAFVFIWPSDIVDILSHFCALCWDYDCFFSLPAGAPRHRQPRHIYHDMHTGRMAWRGARYFRPDRPAFFCCSSRRKGQRSILTAGHRWLSEAILIEQRCDFASHD